MISDLKIIIDVDIREPSNIIVSVKDNYDNTYSIRQDSLLQQLLNELFTQKVSSHTPIITSEVYLLKTQIENLCSQYMQDLIQSTPYSVPMDKVKDNNPPHEITELIKIIASFKNMFGMSKYTKPEQKYILNKITNAIRKVDDPCMDNFRFSDGSKNSLKEYEEIRLTGCCGFYDHTIELKSGKIFMFGFNYGH